MNEGDLDQIAMTPIGFVRRTDADESVRDRTVISQVILGSGLTRALDGIEEWSHIYIIYWLHQIDRSMERILLFPGNEPDNPPVGILATRAPIHPNPIGLTLVELVNRENNVLHVRGLDAYDGTPVLDIKPYPYWEAGRLIVVTDFRIPEWLSSIISKHE